MASPGAVRPRACQRCGFAVVSGETVHKNEAVCAELKQSNREMLEKAAKRKRTRERLVERASG